MTSIKRRCFLHSPVVRLLVVFFLAGVTGADNAAIITDTVEVDGKVWAQVDLFTGLSWLDMNSVCPSGTCSPGGHLNGYEMTGWTWASVNDVNDLFNHYIGLPELGPGPDYFELADSTWAPDFFDDGWRSVDVDPENHMWLPGRLSDPPSACPGPFEGLTCVAQVNDIFAASYADSMWTNGPTHDDYSDGTTGGWFYRPSEVSVDSDSDGLDDQSDNCVLAANPNQRDTDFDDYGNACDADFDQNCIVNAIDLGIMKAFFFLTGDFDADLSGDGLINVIDLGIMKSSFFLPPGPSGITSVCAN